MTAVDRIIDFASSTHDLPNTVRADAIRHVRDTMAVAIAGSTAPGAGGVRQAMRAAGESAACRVLGTSLRLPAPGAAFCTSFQSHCLEWDCVHEPAVVHAMSVVTGAALAVADARGDVSETAFLDALCIGVDIAAGLGLSSRSAMRFFRPATAGLLGAALACARLEKMSPAQMHDVLGLAYSQVSGTMQAHVEGSIALPLQVATAARAAVTAVDLVKQGLSGPHDVLEGSFGYFRLIEPEHDLTAYLAGLGQHWQISDISTKPYPTGRAGQGTISTLQHLQRRHAFSAADIKTIIAHLPPLAHRLIARPLISGMTPAYARLCLPFLASLMLIDGRIDPHRFVPEVFADPAIAALAPRIHAVLLPNPDLNALVPQRLVVELIDGRIFDDMIPHVLGSPHYPMSAAEDEEKFATCLARAETPLSAADEQMLRTDPLRFAISGHAA